GEIAVDHEAGLALDRGRQPARLQLVAAGSGAAILPHDGVMYRLARLAVPDDRGFALIRYPDSGDVRGGEASLGEGLLGCVQLRGPDFSRIVLHPAGLGKDLTELLLRQRDDAPTVVEHDGARAGGALVEGQDVFHAGHTVL